MLLVLGMKQIDLVNKKSLRKPGSSKVHGPWMLVAGGGVGCECV